MATSIKTTLTALLLLLPTTFCHARTLTLAEADTVIMILLFVVLLLLVLWAYALHYNRVITRRNEQLHRILNTLNDYRAIVGDVSLPLDVQEEVMMKKQPKQTVAKAIQMDGSQAFYVKMDARINKEKPFTNPDFEQQALAEFMEVDLDTFRRLVPRYSEPKRTLEYINSLRAEYAAKILMDQSNCPMDEIAVRCGFRDSAAFASAFKFAFGVTPSDYLKGISQMLKKEGASQ